MENKVDIKENYIYQLNDKLLEILLKDHSSNKNILWATDNYKHKGTGYYAHDNITLKAITGRNGLVIKPRVEKSKKEQDLRIKQKAEVFTPSWICNDMANNLDETWFEKQGVFNVKNDKTWTVNTNKIPFTNKTWQDYVKLKVLEISCGEAPFLVSRYDTVTGKWLDVNERVGMLDRKLRVVNENTDNIDNWLYWATEAFKATFGYEWQGDSLLIARENLLFTFIDYYSDRFNSKPTDEQLIEIAKILSWNIWQMDGLKYVIPNSCKPVPKMQLSIFEDEEPEECPSCKKGNNHSHTGIYSKIMNWDTKRSIKFYKGEKKMKFDFVIGNPPYQGDNHQQIYADFYIAGKIIGNCVEMIFPTGWQEPKNANNLRKLNTPEIKEDCQIVFIDNKKNVFTGIAGAEWTNIIMWKHGYDNNLSGKQKVLTNGMNEKLVHLHYDNSQIEKPQYIVKLAEIVKRFTGFQSISEITSKRNPYRLGTDFFKNDSDLVFEKAQNKENIKIYGKSNIIKYVDSKFNFEKVSKAINKYKIFVPYAWGNMSESTAGLGGAFADIIIAYPNEIATETYLESGCFDDFEIAKKHAKYLMTKFARALLYVNKFSQHSTTSWGAIPVQNYTEDFWNKSISEIDVALMDKYNIPKEIREFVFANIQTKTEKNILNFEDGE